MLHIPSIRLAQDMFVKRVRKNLSSGTAWSYQLLNSEKHNEEDLRLEKYRTVWLNLFEHDASQELANALLITSRSCTERIVLNHKLTTYCKCITLTVNVLKSERYLQSSVLRFVRAGEGLS